MKEKVSIFRNYRDVMPVAEVFLSDWLFTSTYQKQVEEIRNEIDPEKRRVMKSALPCITPSGVFTRRSAKGLKKHSGFICMDIDGKENPQVNDWEATKLTIADRVRCLYYCGLSVSGNGLFCIIPISEPERHKEYFDALVKEFDRIGFVVDNMCKDVSRLRGASYDINPVFNENAEPFSIPEEIKIIPEYYQPIMESFPHGKSTVNHNDTDITAYRVGRLVEAVEQGRTNIAESYSDWFAIGRALASEFGEQGRYYFHAISRLSEKYDQAENDIQFNKCLRSCSRTGIATLFYLCRQAGITARQ